MSHRTCIHLNSSAYRERPSEQLASHGFAAIILKLTSIDGCAGNVGYVGLLASCACASCRSIARRSRSRCMITNTK